jgi:hypothetical protein
MGATFGKTPMPRSGPASLLLCGYYGEHNLGDDALLQVLLQGLPGSAPLMITAHDQAGGAGEWRLWPASSIGDRFAPA